MRYHVTLDEASGIIQPTGFDVGEHKTSTALLPVLSVSGGEGCKMSALSCHCSYLATLTHTHLHTNTLYITNLNENRFYTLKRLADACSVLSFHPYQENYLFVATASTKLYCINVDDGSVVELLGHHSPVSGVHCGVGSTSLVSYNTHEALLWSYPALTLTSRLQLQHSLPLVWAGHIWQRDEVVAGFSTGTVVVWSQQQQHSIDPPQSLQLQFEAFAVSRCGEWLVGGGSKSGLVVVYSLTNHCVSQILQLPPTCPSIYNNNNNNPPVFLPHIYLKYPQVLAVQGSAGVLSIIDVTNCTKLKTLRSHRHVIEYISVSDDGGYTCITYSNGVSKIYPTRCLLPVLHTSTVSRTHTPTRDIAFHIIEKREKESEEEREREEKRKERTKDLEELLDKNKWYQVLCEFGSYPDKYRVLIWSCVLKLPRNYSVFSVLLDKGIHTAYEHLEEEYTMCDKRLFRALQRTLSCVAHWSPFLAQVTFLPHLLFPFIKLLHTNLLLCFELSVTLIFNWCRVWFEFWPDISVTVVNTTERLLCDADPTLLAHLIDIKVTAQHYIWTPLTTAFSTVLSDSDWLTLWDHILSNPPSFLPCVAVAFTIASRNTLLSCSNPTQVKFECLPLNGLPHFTIGTQCDEQQIDNLEEEMCQRESNNINNNNLAKTKQQQQQQAEDMVYTVARTELWQQQQQCLDSIINMRKRHLW
ncbi:hypothetical protein Pmani_000527 [Petrolisthes manimaculis]|uniref:Rab-GAP TBC domain-containing protein n=1 Tax=Petrolisthes manimaculis TaxID=1843537 RepID=A0AAE1QLU7_9EUCA|nr:hypothetical protein Pmani_000527 [Petrolisthes manimaculis]